MDISILIIDNLGDVGIKEGDLSTLSRFIKDLIFKREEQGPEIIGDLISAKLFSTNIRKIIDAIFIMDENWKRLERIHVYNLTTQFLELILP